MAEKQKSFTILSVLNTLVYAMESQTAITAAAKVKTEQVEEMKMREEETYNLAKAREHAAEAQLARDDHHNRNADYHTDAAQRYLQKAENAGYKAQEHALNVQSNQRLADLAIQHQHTIANNGGYFGMSMR